MNPELLTPELIIKTVGDNTTESHLIKFSEKQDMRDQLKRVLDKNINDSNLRVKKDYFEQNVVAEGVLYSNFIKLFQYNNVLFVPHFNAGLQLKWSTESSFSYDVMFQLIPVLMNRWGRREEVYIVDSNERRYRFIMRGVYQDYDIPNLITRNQYSFDEDFEFEYLYREDNDEVVRFDAVVFLSTPNTETSVEEIRTRWAEYCTDNFDIIHLKESGSTLIGDKVDIEDKIQLIVNQRKEVDSAYRDDPALSKACEDLLRKTISVY